VDGVRPFSNLESYRYAINSRGLEYARVPAHG